MCEHSKSMEREGYGHSINEGYGHSINEGYGHSINVKRGAWKHNTGMEKHGTNPV
jgi:hypothetical protein